MNLLTGGESVCGSNDRLDSCQTCLSESSPSKLKHKRNHYKVWYNNQNTCSIEVSVDAHRYCFTVYPIKTKPMDSLFSSNKL